MARSPSGSANSGYEPVGLRKSAFKPCVVASSLIISLPGLSKKPAGFRDNQARASRDLGIYSAGPALSPGSWARA